MPDVEVPAFVCPRCHGPLDDDARSYRCSSCAAEYPIVLGIPDFRIFPDPWIGIEDDRAKARRVAELAGSAPFEDAVRAYWELTPTTPRDLAARFTRHVLGAKERSADWLDRLDDAESPTPGPWLDIGCGTADLVAAAAARGITVVGVDIALRWLAVAAYREELGRRTSLLVCANGEHLPFPSASFARVVSLGTLEHCRDAERVLCDARRVLRPGGVLRVTTVNRYSLLSEPHVGVWGVGLLPRRWADRYVQWRRGLRYVNHRPLSPREITRGFRRAGFAQVRIAPAPILPADRSRLGAWTRRVVPLYERLRRTSISAALLRWVAPLLDARGVAA